MSDLIDSNDYTYDDCKERLYNRMGISNTQAGIKIFEMWSEEFSETNQRESVTKLFSLYERYFNKCDSRLDFYVAIGKALYRWAIQPADQAFWMLGLSRLGKTSLIRLIPFRPWQIQGGWP